jgi:hypothetical protein
MHPASMPLGLHTDAGAGPDDRLAEAERADPTTLTAGRGSSRSEDAISEFTGFLQYGMFLSGI